MNNQNNEDLEAEIAQILLSFWVSTSNLDKPIFEPATTLIQQLITAEVREARINSEEWHLNRLIDLTNGFKTLDEVKTATHDRIKQLKSKEG